MLEVVRKHGVGAVGFYSTFTNVQQAVRPGLGMQPEAALEGKRSWPTAQRAQIAQWRVATDFAKLVSTPVMRSRAITLRFVALIILLTSPSDYYAFDRFDRWSNEFGGVRNDSRPCSAKRDNSASAHRPTCLMTFAFAVLPGSPPASPCFRGQV